ncbi:MAG: hypothetical protein ACP5JF_05320 [Candidatus Methanodesulfokora sp.]|jgi:hypothetical protein
MNRISVKAENLRKAVEIFMKLREKYPTRSIEVFVVSNNDRSGDNN